MDVIATPAVANSTNRGDHDHGGTSSADVNTGDSHQDEGEGDAIRGNGRMNNRSGENGPMPGTPSQPQAHDDDNDENGDGKSQMSLEELLYSASSYHAIAKPVVLTMILTALAVTYINTEETIQEGQEQLASTYTVFSTTGADGESKSTGETLGLSLVNALIIVSVICAMTFLIVLLYHFRLMKCLIGYMIITSTVLLGLLGGTMFKVAIDKYQLAIDQFSYYFTLYNFAIVGTVSIFFQHGIPTYVTQGYLIATSVILAWQLSYFDSWTAWTLLVMLALYDLCAVLTPCGPLKALVNLMSRDDSPNMPGLLYEAELPSEVQRPGRARGRNSRGNGRDGGESVSNANASRGRDQRIGPPAATPVRHSGTGTTATNGSRHQQQEDQREREESNSATSSSTSVEEGDNDIISDTSNTIITVDSRMDSVELTNGSGIAQETAPSPPEPSYSATDTGTGDNTTPAAPRRNLGVPNEAPRGIIPLAIAKLYRLPLVTPVEPARRPSLSPLLEARENQGDEASSPNTLFATQYTPEQLRQNVEVIFPRVGGRIEHRQGNDGEPRYMVISRDGEVKRTLVLDQQGKVYEERIISSSGNGDDESEDKKFSNSIKLGLGDFIFYSVLVSKAAQYSFTTFAACALVILGGLGGTLVLLAVYHQTLPALPISIFLGVIFYLLTRLVIEPWIQDLLRTPFYV